jgi:hypothetical protein
MRELSTALDEGNRRWSTTGRVISPMTAHELVRFTAYRMPRVSVMGYVFVARSRVVSHPHPPVM